MEEPMSKLTDPMLRDCISECWTCRDACQSTLYNHCLDVGGQHVMTAHVRIMADCIQACQTAADFMTRGSNHHAAICTACADVCEACAESCEALDDNHMRACAEACRSCAESCRSMSRMEGDLSREYEQTRPHTPPS
jgi:hypothetical protein